MIITNQQCPVSSNKSFQRDGCDEEGRTDPKPTGLSSGTGSAINQLVTFGKGPQLSALRGLKERTFRVLSSSNIL